MLAARHGWVDIAASGNGVNFELTSNAVSMYNDLMSIIDEACLPRPAEERGAMLESLFYYDNYIYAYTRYDHNTGLCL